MQRKDIKETILEYMRNSAYAPMTAEDLLDAPNPFLLSCELFDFLLPMRSASNRAADSSFRSDAWSSFAAR